MSVKEYVKLDRVMALNWNGREIRNGEYTHYNRSEHKLTKNFPVFHTAVALAVYDANFKKNGATPYLSDTYLEQVLAMSTAFKDYMKDTHQGRTDCERAAYHELRNDSPIDTSRETRGTRAGAKNLPYRDAAN